MSEQEAEEEVERQWAADNEPEGIRQSRWTAILLVATGAMQVLINTPWVHTWLTVHQKLHKITLTTITRRAPYQDLRPRTRPQLHLPRCPPDPWKKSVLPTLRGMQLRSSTKSVHPFG